MKRLTLLLLFMLVLVVSCSTGETEYTLSIRKTTPCICVSITPIPSESATPTPTLTHTLVPTVVDTFTPTPTLTSTPTQIPTPDETTVILNPGDNIQTRINAAPLGTTFVFSTAVYERVSIRPRTGDTYIGQESILDGMGTTYKAFSALDQPNDPDRPRNVTISGFEIRNYISHTSAESNLSPEGALEGAEGWFIGGNYIHHNKAGISLGKGNWGWGDGSIIQNNTITDNGEIGVEINGSNILFEGNELARNGYSLSNKAADWMGAASKFTDQPVWSDNTYSSFIRLPRTSEDQLVIRGNYSHRNNGMGLWLDVFNQNALVEENTIELNRSSGIFDELSTGTIIRNNIVRLNRLNNTNTGLWGGAEIFAANSESGLVAGNTITVSGNGRGVILVDESYRIPRMHDYRVIGNTITYTAKPVYGANNYSPVAGITGGGGNEPFQTANNLFDGNTYILPFGSTSLDLFWYWDGGMSWGGFRSKGHETNGSVQVTQ